MTDNKKSWNPENVFYISVATVVIAYKVCNTAIRIFGNK